MKLGLVLLLGAASALGCGDADYEFDGTVEIYQASGALFRYEGQPMQAEALVLTASHVIGWDRLDGAHADLDAQFWISLPGAEPLTLRGYQVLYATMLGTDLAVMRLADTYEDIATEHNLNALTLSRQRGIVGEEIVVPAAYPEHVTRCHLDGFVSTLREGPYTWTDSLRYSDACETFVGTSGAPVISVETGQIIGVNNTGNDGNDDLCELSNPCEVDADGNVSGSVGDSYGQQTNALYNCIDGSFELDFNLPGCPFPEPEYQ